jgi:hypothetical protein
MRLPGWRGRLSAYVARARGKAFAYGEHDCALFAAGAVAAVTGRDLAAEFRGQYRCAMGGLRAVQRAGYIDHVDMATALFPRVPASQLETGDLAVVRADRSEALGVVSGPAIFVLREHGLGRVDLQQAIYGLRV